MKSVYFARKGKNMTVEEAREILGYKKNDVVVKSGLWNFQKSYKKWLKEPNVPAEIRKTIERDLAAVEVLLNEKD